MNQLATCCDWIGIGACVQASLREDEPMTFFRFIAAVVLSFLATLTYLLYVTDGTSAGEGHTLSDTNVQNERFVARTSAIEPAG